MPDFDFSYNYAIIIATYVSAILGVLGSLFTIITFLLFKNARNVGTSLIFCLAIGDFFLSFGLSVFWIIFDQENHVACNIQGIVVMFGICASLMWSLMIGIFMFLILGVEIEKVGKFHVWFHVIAWGYSIICAIIPIFFGKYGYGIMHPGSAGKQLTWCWVSDRTSPFRVIFYAPDTVIFILLSFMYGLIQYRLNRIPSSFVRKMCSKMRLYLLAYALLNAFAVTNRLQNYISGKDVFALYIGQFATQPLQGLFNAFVYAWNEPAFKENYKNLFARCIPNPQKKAENERLLAHVCYDDSRIF